MGELLAEAWCRGAVSRHEPDRQREVAGFERPVMDHMVEQQLRGPFSEFDRRLANGRERGRHPPGEVDIVEADDRDVRGHAQSPLLKLGDDAESHEVVAREDRGDLWVRLHQERPEKVPRSLCVVAAELNRIREDLSEPGRALVARHQTVRPAEHRDGSMTQLPEMLAGEEASLPVVGCDERAGLETGYSFVDDHERVVRRDRRQRVVPGGVGCVVDETVRRPTWAPS